MKTALAIIFFTTTLMMPGLAEARNCKKGKPCGNSCISKNDVCHKNGGTSEAVSETPVSAAPAAEATSHAAKHCKKGKACGNSCIPKDAVCSQ